MRFNAPHIVDDLLLMRISQLIHAPFLIKVEDQRQILRFLIREYCLFYSFESSIHQR